MEPLEWERQIWAKRRSKPPPCVLTFIMESSAVSRDTRCTLGLLCVCVEGKTSADFWTAVQFWMTVD